MLFSAPRSTLCKCLTIISELTYSLFSLQAC
jgi:hypothetical protein